MDEQIIKSSTQQLTHSTLRLILLEKRRKLRHALGVYLLQLLYAFRSLRGRLPLFPVRLDDLLTIALSVCLLNEKHAIILHGRYMGIEGRETDRPSQISVENSLIFQCTYSNLARSSWCRVGEMYWETISQASLILPAGEYFSA